MCSERETGELGRDCCNKVYRSALSWTHLQMLMMSLGKVLKGGGARRDTSIEQSTQVSMTTLRVATPQFHRHTYIYQLAYLHCTTTSLGSALYTQDNSTSLHSWNRKHISSVRPDKPCMRPQGPTWSAACRHWLECNLALFLVNSFLFNSTWSSTYVTNLNRIYCSQKQAVRAFTNSDYRAHSAPLFSKLAKFMYYYHNNLFPPLFFNLFFTNSQIHGYSTRTANNYRVHHCRTNLKKFTILYQGPKIWNSLPVTITSLSSFPARVFSKIITALAKPHTVALFM